MIKAEPGDTISLSVSIDDGTTTLYPQCKIYDTSNNLIDTVNLSHVANGFYQGSYTPNGNYKHLTGHYRIYTDSGYTVLSDYAAVSDKIYVAYDAKPSFGGGTGTVGLSKNDLELIKKLIKEQIVELKDAIDKKSDFDPLKDKVKTDIQIPSFPNLREIKDTLSLVLEELKKPKNVKIQQKDYTSEIKNLERLVKGIKFPDNSKLEKKIDGIEKEARFSESDLNKVTILIGKILKANLTTQEDMLEALNVQEDKRHKKLEQFLRAIIYALQNIKNQPADNSDIIVGLQELLSQKNAQESF